MSATSPAGWMKVITARCPAARTAVERAARIRGQLLPYQATALFELVHSYAGRGAHILEIGTAAGYSAAVMAQAAPDAQIVTLNAAAHEIQAAIKNLRPYPNATVRLGRSWEILPKYEGPALDVIFVDGDHRRAALDVPWFNWAAVGGLMLFHDFTRSGSMPVVIAVRGMAIALGREPDVLIEDSNGIGMAGFYRREAERLG